MQSLKDTTFPLGRNPSHVNSLWQYCCNSSVKNHSAVSCAYGRYSGNELRGRRGITI